MGEWKGELQEIRLEGSDVALEKDGVQREPSRVETAILRGKGARRTRKRRLKPCVEWRVRTRPCLGGAGQGLLLASLLRLWPQPAGQCLRSWNVGVGKQARGPHHSAPYLCQGRFPHRYFRRMIRRGIIDSDATWIFLLGYLSAGGSSGVSGCDRSVTPCVRSIVCWSALSMPVCVGRVSELSWS